LVVGIVGEIGEGVVTMPNQLIQKKGKPLVREPVKEVPMSILLSVKKLREGFEKVHLEEGLKHLARLEAEHKGLSTLLDSSGVEDTVLNLERVSKLTSSLYQQGLSFLAKALNVAEQLSASSKEDLVAESEELKTELGKCTPGSTLHNMVAERLASNTKSIRIVKEFHEKMDEYFCQVGLCRDSIREIRLGLPELIGNKPRDEFDKILLELKTRVELAQRVQAEYTKQGI